MSLSPAGLPYGLAYWPVLWSAKQTAGRINAEIQRKAHWLNSRWPVQTAPLELNRWREVTAGRPAPGQSDPPVNHG